VTFGTLVFSFLTLILIYYFLKKFFDAKLALISTIAMFICSSMFYYTYHDPSMSHVFSAFTVTSFVYYWHKTQTNRTLPQHILLGFLGGLMALTRWQDSIFLVLILYDLFKFFRNKNHANVASEMIKKAAFLFFAAMTFIPQMIFWKVIYGHFLIIPPSAIKLFWYPKYLFYLLFSTKHGLFVWTPLILISLIGLYFFWKKNKELCICLTIPLILEMLFISSTSDWHGSWSYGIRSLTSCTLIFAVGLCAMMTALSRKIALKLIIIMLVPFILWNILLMTQIHYNHLLIDPDYPFAVILLSQITDAPMMFIRLAAGSLFGITI
jgi:hypothetical protein